MERVRNSRYAHIVVPTRLTIDDFPVLTLGMEMAAVHRAMLTVLHVRPAAEPSPGGLHAISLLHRAVDCLHRPAAAEDEFDPQERMSVTTTWSPTLTFSTPLPTASTMPAASCP
jgi:hypothetical protein